MNLSKLIQRYQMQAARRKRAKTPLARSRAGRAMRKLSDLAYRATPGFPYWGGGRALVAELVRPVVARKGIAITSQKRWETYGNPGSDHYKGNRTAYAEDYATASNYALAQEIRTALEPGAIHVDYQTFIVEFRGHRFAVQIIAGTHGTGPHLHVGVHLVD